MRGARRRLSGGRRAGSSRPSFGRRHARCGREPACGPCYGPFPVREILSLAVAVRYQEPGSWIAAIGDGHRVADGVPGAGLRPGPAVVAIARQQPADRHDQAGRPRAGASAPARRRCVTNLLKARGLSQVNGAVQDDSDAVITPDTVEIIAVQDHLQDSRWGGARATRLWQSEGAGQLADGRLHTAAVSRSRSAVGIRCSRKWLLIRGASSHRASCNSPSTHAWLGSQRCRRRPCPRRPGVC